MIYNKGNRNTGQICWSQFGLSKMFQLSPENGYFFCKKKLWNVSGKYLLNKTLNKQHFEQI
jgi:hypothetical protein